MKINFFPYLAASLVLTAASLILATNLAAEETSPKPLVGISYGQAKANFNNYSSSSTGGAGFLLGVEYEKFRVYADLAFYEWQGSPTKNPKWKKAKTRTIYANADYQHQFKPWLTGFAGLYFGLVDLEFDNPKDYQSGLAGGAQAGVILPLGQSNWQLEAAARFSAMNAEQDLPAKEGEAVEKAKITGQSEAQLRLLYVY